MNSHEHQGKSVAQVNGYEIIQCTTCGFKHAMPVPTPQQLSELYQAQPFVNQPEPREQEWLLRMYQDRYETFEELLPPERRSVFDVGSGAGTFLLCGKNRGWQGYGQEPCEALVAYSREQGLQVDAAFFDAEHARELPLFDVIHIAEVLEHVPDPVGFLQLALEKLAPGGILCIMAANEFNPIQQAYRSIRDIRPWWLVPPVHINYFDAQSLPALLTRLGLEVVRKEATFPIDWFLLMEEEYIDQPELGRCCHERRRAFELNIAAGGQNDVKRKLYQAMAEASVGREIVVYARNPL